MKLAPVLALPRAQEAIYKSGLLRLSSYCAKLIKEKLVSSLPSLIAQRNNILRHDDFLDDLERILAALSVDLDLTNPTNYNLLSSIIPDIEAIAVNSTLFTLRQLARYLPLPAIVTPSYDLSINIFANDNEALSLAKSFAMTNSRLIKTIPAEMLDDVALIVQTGFRQGTRAEDLKAEIAKKFDISENRARLIARDQLSKLSADLTREKNIRYGLRDYIWRSTLADNTRPSHAALNNKICTYDDVTTYRNSLSGKTLQRSSINGVEANPAQPVQCRCQALAIIPS